MTGSRNAEDSGVVPLFEVLKHEFQELHGTLKHFGRDDFQNNQPLADPSLRPATEPDLKQEPEQTDPQAALREIWDNVHRLKRDGRTALCLSGGGVRSAAFNLGVLQGLARYKKIRPNQVPDGPERRLSKKTLDNEIWRTFRSVAPFWGAARIIADETALASGTPDGRTGFGPMCGPFPCGVENFVRFLAYADALRQRGECHRQRQSRWPQLLAPAEMVRIPDRLSLKLMTFHSEIYSRFTRE
jgi:hypothetical protein